jgi:putative autotransporter adhesin-like protein
MKTLLKISALLFLFISTTSCVFDGVKGNGDVITKKRKISNDFTKIKVSRGLDVYITKNSNVSLVVEADENLHDLIKTDVKNGTLIITSEKNIWKARSKKIHLSVENINEILVSSGAEVYSENTLSSNDMKVTASSGSEANLSLQVNNLVCESSSGADIKLTGKAIDFDVSASSGSDILAYNLKAENCTAKASSGSDIKVYVTGTFDGTATSGADIRYKGNPKVVRKNSNSGGSIKSSN